MLFAKRLMLRKEASATGERRVLTNCWHAVEISSPQPTCPAATKLVKHRFLSGEAPTLPLQDCTCASRCRCVYQHFDDRRQAGRRSVDEGGPPPPFYQGTERRHALGRRKDDLP